MSDHHSVLRALSEAETPVDITVVELVPTTPKMRRRFEQRATQGIVAIAGIGGAVLSSASPTEIWLIDAIYTCAFVSTITLATTRARRWTWALLAGTAAIAAGTLVLQLASLSVLGVTLWSTVTRVRRRWVGALVGAISVLALLSQGQGPLWRLSSGSLLDPFGTSAVITCVAVLPIIATAWRTLSRRQRQSMKIHAKRCLLVLVAVLAVTGGVIGMSASSLRSGIDQTITSMELLRSGHLDEAADSLEEANASWDRANSWLSGPWMTPSRIIPVLGQHVRVAQTVTGQAAAVTDSAETVVSNVDPDALFDNGVIDVEAIDQQLPAIDAFANTLERATLLIDATESRWLLPPVAERLEMAGQIIGPSAGVADASAQGLHLANDLFGPSNPSQILVMFSTPAEARGSGGFIGSWAIISGAEGRLEITEQYRTRELNALLGANDAVLRADADFSQRYGRFDIEHHIQDVTISPDFPSVARVTADLFEQATGETVDAVVMVDPFVIGKVLGLTGPVTTESGFTLSQNNLLDYLFVDQYEQFSTDEGGREAELSQVTQAIFAAVLNDPPDPVAAVSELAPLVEQQRLTMWIRRDAGGQTAERLGLDGAFPGTEGDLFGIVHQNAGQNKVDSFLHRSIDISTRLDHATNSVSHEITISLRNDAPDSGLPDAIIGSNDQNLDPGANSMLLSVYSGVPILDATIDGEPASFESAGEFGRQVATFLVTVPAGATVALELNASGSIDLTSGYDITLVNQPVVNPDSVSWTIRGEGSERLLTNAAGWGRSTDGLAWDSTVDKDRVFTFDFDG